MYSSHRTLVLSLLFVICIHALAAQTGGPRFALVIGNSGYTGLPQLRNPANDAHDVAEVLGKLGFSVTPLYDGTRKQMDQAIAAFRESLSSDRSSEGFFYYAGHGVQAKGANYLIPIGADIRSEADLDDEAVNLQRVLGNIEEAQNRVNVVILDACRDNPLPASSRSAARGLAVVASAPPESIVLFSTAQNQTAADGEGRNSPFAAALVKYLPEPGDISRTIKLVTAEVKRATGSVQTPFQYTSLDFDYELNRVPAPAPAPALVGTASAGTAEAKNYKVGDTGPAGGIIFYDKGTKTDGWEFLEVARNDLGRMNWTKAVQACANFNGGGFLDWKLPDNEQLDLLYQNLQNKGLGDFAPNPYWSSSVYDSGNAFRMHFGGGRLLGKKTYHRKEDDAGGWVRPIRAFSPD